MNSAWIGHWVGGFNDTDEHWQFMQVSIAKPGNADEIEAGDSTILTVDIPLNGQMGLTPNDLSIDAKTIRFAVTVAGDIFAFQGILGEGTITGTVTSEPIETTFQLMPVAVRDFAFPSRYMGLYQLASDHTIFIGNMTGAPVSVYYDFKSRRIGALWAQSDGRYFSGRRLFIPIETDVRIQFLSDEITGDVTRMHWQPEGGSSTVAPKITMIEEDVHFTNGDISLAGTLICPTALGKHPAIVMVHGSGAQTRHMVRLYADAFAQQGIATLIYDKRGTGGSTGEWSSSYEDLAYDALAGIQLLQSHPSINPDQIGLCGASQAGWIIPIAAARSTSVAFTVLLVSPVITIARQNELNVEYTMRASGFPEAEIAEAVAHISLFNHVLCTGERWDKFQQSLAKGRQSLWAKFAWPLENPPAPESLAGRRKSMLNDPLPILQKVTCPILAIFGEADTVVPYEENRALMEEALQTSGHDDFTVHVLPKCSHIFLESETGADAEFPMTTHWLPQHIELITEWVKVLTM